MRSIIIIIISLCVFREDSKSDQLIGNANITGQVWDASQSGKILCKNWKEFIENIAKAQPGDTIQLKDGTYIGYIEIYLKGTEEKPILIIPENRGRVILTGNSQWKIAGEYIVIDGFHFSNGTSSRPIRFTDSSSHCKLLNTAVTEWNPMGVDTRWVSVGGRYHEIGYCFFRKKNTSGMMLEVIRSKDERNDHHIHHVYFGYFKNPGSGNGYETVRLGTSGHSLSDSYTLLENCIFECCDGESEIISSKSGHNIFRNNTFINSNGALTLRHGHDARVEGNYFTFTKDTVTSRCTGVRVIGENHLIRNNYFDNLPGNSPVIWVQYGNRVPHKLTQYDQVKEAMIENNSIVNCDGSVVLGAAKRLNDDPPRILPPNGVFRNNLIYEDVYSITSILIERGVVSDSTFHFFNNSILSPNMKSTDQNQLPEGIQRQSDGNIKEYNGLILWSGDHITWSGIEKNTVNPLSVKDITPEWIQKRIESDDPNFTTGL